MQKFSTLLKINCPADLRQLSAEQLPTLCQELREYLLETVSQSSGHLASGLGVVELTVALHYIFNTPDDQLIWDVGHQAYPHKILTGRREQMQSIRKKNGLHPFPWREESEYDVLSVGHSSTSISAGLGIALANQQANNQRKTICVIGDGAITAGMAFEALNHAGALRSDMLVILNDNGMSISQNVGGLNNYFTCLMCAPLYTNLRDKMKTFLARTPVFREFVKKTEEHIKGFVSPVATMFEQLGFNYIGVIDGNNIEELLTTLRNLQKRTGPQFLHIKTKKGKGYEPAECDPTSYHGVPKFDHKQRELPVNAGQTYSKIFGNWLEDMAQQDPKLMAITPAMGAGSGMTNFAKNYPNQFLDVAIAEQHAVTLAAGLAIGGLKPVVAIYSTFLQRAYDQLIHDVAIQNLPVLFAIDRAGVVGEDGQTHQGAFDLSFMRCIPNLVIMTPSSANQCRQMLYTGYTCGKPSAVRYPKGMAYGEVSETMEAIPLGKGKIIRQGKNLSLLNFGTLLPHALEVGEYLNATVVDMRFVKPIDFKLLRSLMATHLEIVTLEENALQGGAGSAVNEFLIAERFKGEILNLGFPDYFIPQGSQSEILADLGLNTEGILRSINTWRN